MSSKAFYKSGRAPNLIHRILLNTTTSIEVWVTTCIVSNFGKNIATTDVSKDSSIVGRWTLINPSNPGLTGCRNFPYFPRGGPVPEAVHSMHKDWQPLGFVSTWGGMEVGTGMLFPVSVVDGLVHQRGGWQLQAELQWKRLLTAGGAEQELCPIGAAVTTSAAGDLSENYDSIVHTTPPFYRHDENPEAQLARCYESALAQAVDNHGENEKLHHNIAAPLLGAGCRGFPTKTACSVAAATVVPWLMSNNGNHHHKTLVAFGLLEETVAAQLVEILKQSL